MSSASQRFAYNFSVFACERVYIHEPGLLNPQWATSSRSTSSFTLFVYSGSQWKSPTPRLSWHVSDPRLLRRVNRLRSHILNYTCSSAGFIKYNSSASCVTRRRRADETQLRRRLWCPPAVRDNHQMWGGEFDTCKSAHCGQLPGWSILLAGTEPERERERVSQPRFLIKSTQSFESQSLLFRTARVISIFGLSELDWRSWIGHFCHCGA